MSEVNETVVAVVEPTVKSNPDSKESVFTNEISVIEADVQSIEITDNESYEVACELGRTIQTKAKEVEAFFKPMKDTAHKAHKEICDREKAMLAPLNKAKSALQKAVGAYQFRIEQERKAEEERLKAEARKEAERSLAEAVEAEANGDTDGAESALMDAQLAESMADSAVVASKAPKASGVSVSVDYELTSCDAKKVPVEVNGTVIRPVDEKAVLKLIRESEGKISIPGITFKAVPKTSFRRF